MRPADNQDVPVIMAALLKMLAKNPGGQMQFAEPIQAECSVYAAVHEGRAFMVDGYFIMVDHGSDWYTTKKYLIEQIILKVQPTDKPVAVAIAALDTLKEKFGCVAIAAGDTQVGYMIPHYHAAGYITLGTQLFKE